MSYESFSSLPPEEERQFVVFEEFTQQNIQPNETVTNNVTTYGGGSAWNGGPIFHGGDPCSGSGNPGDIVFDGSVSANAGSGNAICSVTPSSLPVVLRLGNPTAQ